MRWVTFIERHGSALPVVAGAPFVELSRTVTAWIHATLRLLQLVSGPDI